MICHLSYYIVSKSQIYFLLHGRKYLAYQTFPTYSSTVYKRSFPSQLFIKTETPGIVETVLMNWDSPESVTLFLTRTDPRLLLHHTCDLKNKVYSKYTVFYNKTDKKLVNFYIFHFFERVILYHVILFGCQL